MFSPPKPVDDLIPLSNMLTGRQPPCVVVERREHGTTISLCRSDRRRANGETVETTRPRRSTTATGPPLPIVVG